jgi:hypothetical protein
MISMFVSCCAVTFKRLKCPVVVDMVDEVEDACRWLI